LVLTTTLSPRIFIHSQTRLSLLSSFHLGPNNYTFSTLSSTHSLFRLSLLSSFPLFTLVLTTTLTYFLTPLLFFLSFILPSFLPWTYQLQRSCDGGGGGSDRFCLHGDFGRRLRPRTSAGDFGLRLRPATSAGDFGRRLRPATSASDFGRRLWPATLPLHSYSVGVPPEFKLVLSCCLY
jgi:hypothetical protein